MLRKTIRSFALVLLVFSCVSAEARVGAGVHEWSARDPFGHEYGIVEWSTGTSTVYLGIVSFGVPCGAYKTAAIVTTVLVLFVAMLIGFATQRGRHRKL
jgi:hypothetical protein